MSRPHVALVVALLAVLVLALPEQDRVARDAFSTTSTARSEQRDDVDWAFTAVCNNNSPNNFADLAVDLPQATTGLRFQDLFAPITARLRAPRSERQVRPRVSAPVRRARAPPA